MEPHQERQQDSGQYRDQGKKKILARDNPVIRAEETETQIRL